MTADGNLNVQDIVALVNIILLSTELNSDQFQAADITQDGNINVQDIVALVNFVLGDGLARGKGASKANIFYGNGQVSYESDGNLAGFQFEIEGDYTINTKYIPDGWRLSSNDDIILIYSLDGSSLNSSLLFDYEGSFDIKSIIISDWYGNDIETSRTLLPEAYALLSAYPNPFNPETNINFEIPVSSNVTIEVFNLQGRLIETLYNKELQPGKHRITWNADGLMSGIYFVKMSSNNFNDYKKIILMK